MRAVLGIGNPGAKYNLTRHNIGFMVLDSFAEVKNLRFVPSKFDFEYSGGNASASHFILVKPTTYVNLTGMAARDLVQEFDVDIENLLVISDDVNLPTGTIRPRNLGGDGGHNGLNSIIYHLNSDKFPRIRFGIGADFSKGLMADYVLTKFSKSELQQIEPSIKLCTDLINNFIDGGSEKMFEFYSKKINQQAKSSDPSNREVN